MYGPDEATLAGVNFPLGWEVFGSLEDKRLSGHIFFGGEVTMPRASLARGQAAAITLWPFRPHYHRLFSDTIVQKPFYIYITKNTIGAFLK